MKHRPISFNAHGVRAILAGTKTQTRRPFVMPSGMQWYTKELSGNPQFFDGERTGSICSINGNGWWEIEELECPFGKVGETLWVREDFLELGHWIDDGSSVWSSAGCVHYVADGNAPKAPDGLIWRPKAAADMQRKHSRITLEITSKRLERLQDISEKDCEAEGVLCETADPWFYHVPEPGNVYAHADDYPRGAYQKLWVSIYGAGSWPTNPWVRIIEFRRAT